MTNKSKLGLEIKEFTERPNLKQAIERFNKEGKQVYFADFYRSKDKWFTFVFLDDSKGLIEKRV